MNSLVKLPAFNELLPSVSLSYSVTFKNNVFDHFSKCGAIISTNDFFLSTYAGSIGQLTET